MWRYPFSLGSVSSYPPDVIQRCRISEKQLWNELSILRSFFKAKPASVYSRSCPDFSTGNLKAELHPQFNHGLVHNAGENL